ncbi:hypothetical protein BYT27DRAFT_7264688 [Phlegmacium glaucopus]|nr:hypothetical protein BYT27DRAFT_7264688 [Phlegmacium glaucopus]
MVPTPSNETTAPTSAAIFFSIRLGSAGKPYVLGERLNRIKIDLQARAGVTINAAEGAAGGGHNNHNKRQTYRRERITRDRSATTHPGHGTISSQIVPQVFGYLLDTEHISAYEVPIVDLGRGTTTEGSTSPAVIPRVSPSAPQPSTPACANTPLLGCPTRTQRQPPTQIYKKVRIFFDTFAESVEDDDYHKISSGSDTESADMIPLLVFERD